jgi:arginyl-tRNA synthetase
MRKFLEEKIREAIGILQSEGVLPVFEVPEIRVEYPKDEKHGEYATNIALACAKGAKMDPMKIAELIREKLKLSECERIEVAPPGYVNFYLSADAFSRMLAEVDTLGARYGEGEKGEGIYVNNEFVSANPTGPLHLGNGRGGFFGDSLSRILRKAGFSVTNEYYINDGGEQVMKLGHSVLRDEEAVYGGTYIEELTRTLETDGPEFAEGEDLVRTVGAWAAEEVMTRHIRPSLSERMRIHYDSFVSERRNIVEVGLPERAMDIFREKELLFESEGATWLRTTDFGDDKDRVLVKSDGTHTYFLNDCGYLLRKIEGGADRLVLTLGADHHGYVGRLRAAAEALGFSGRFDIFIVQLVRLMKDGKEVRMSKRAGNVVSIDELVDRVGHDVTRFFFLMYSPDTHMNFDLGLAGEQSEKNPVFYVQYAHARLSSILRKAEEVGLEPEMTHSELLDHPKERALLRELLIFPELISDIAGSGAVHHLPQYAIRLADRLHSFYADCRVVDETHPELSGARLGLVSAVRSVLAETLRLIGVDVPERM